MPLILTTPTNPGTAAWSAASVSNVIVASGVAVIPAGTQVSLPIAVGAAYDGLPVVLSFLGVPFNPTAPVPPGVVPPDPALVAVTSNWDGAGNLIIAGNLPCAGPPALGVYVLYAVIAPL